MGLLLLNQGHQKLWMCSILVHHFVFYIQISVDIGYDINYVDI